jgi:hypothetical protein
MIISRNASVIKRSPHRDTIMKNLVIAAALTALFATVSSSAFAEGRWAQNHPRRHEVNQRLNHANARTNREVRNGRLTSAQGQQLHHEDHQIRQEERSMASQDGGHITRQEQRTLNQQENGVNQQRRTDLRNDRAASTTTASAAPMGSPGGSIPTVNGPNYTPH